MSKADFAWFFLAHFSGGRYSRQSVLGEGPRSLLILPLALHGGGTVYVACSSLCFGRYSLKDALHAISELRFQKVDLALHESGPHLKPSHVAADVNRAAQLLRKANVAYAAFHVEIDAPTPDDYRETLRAVCKLGRVLAVPVVNIAAAPIGTEMHTEVARLTILNRVAEAEGVMLTV